MSQSFLVTTLLTRLYGEKMHYTLEYGQATFDPLNGIIHTSSGVTIKLRHAESLLLQCLLKKISNKREIIEFVWENMVVADGSYHKLIFDLRNQFLAAGLDATLIKTIPRRGLMYTGQWEEHNAPSIEPPTIVDELSPPQEQPYPTIIDPLNATFSKKTKPTIYN